MSSEASSWMDIFLRRTRRINKLMELLKKAGWFEHYHPIVVDNSITYQRCDNPYHELDIQEQYGEDDCISHARSPFSHEKVGNINTTPE